MGFLDFLKPRTGYSMPELEEMASPIVDVVQADVLKMPPEEIWRTQPYLRTVVGFISRNIAQIGMHVLTRDPGGGRSRVRDGPAADLLGRPNDTQTLYEFVVDLVSTLMLYDEVLVWVHHNESDGRRAIRVLKPSWIVGYRDPGPFDRGTVQFLLPNESSYRVAEQSELLSFHGWDPIDTVSGDPPVNVLRGILAEQAEAVAYRLMVWRKGGRVGTYISRPADAKWDNEARNRFTRMFRAQYTGRGGAGVPLLEDGMEMKKLSVSAREEDFVDGAKLSLQTVASVFHINPTMLGLLDNANYSNVKEFRRMLYGDSLGPILSQIEARMNSFLLPMLGESGDHYVEFNLKDKLRGSFEEQGALYRAGVGAPWMTVNEARERENLPKVDGGDEMIRPLNVGTSVDGSDGTGSPGSDPSPPPAE